MLAACHSQQKESAEEDECLGHVILGHSLDKLTANGILCFWPWQQFPIYREDKGSNFSLRHDNAKIRHIIISCLEPQTLASFFQNKQANNLSKQK
jgi:hypothetical protein